MQHQPKLDPHLICKKNQLYSIYMAEYFIVDTVNYKPLSLSEHASRFSFYPRYIYTYKMGVTEILPIF